MKSMKSITFERIAGITMLITGVGHTSTHFILQTVEHPHPELELAMSKALLKIGSEISVLDFHNGFSLAMGTLLLAFGLHILRNSDKVGLWINSLIAGLMVGISLLYFPVFVVILTSISLVTLLISLYIYDN